MKQFYRVRRAVVNLPIARLKAEGFQACSKPCPLWAWQLTLGAESRKNNPDRWTKEKRTKYNDRVKMIQWLFDTQQYVSAKQSLDWLDSDFQLTGRKFADKSNKNNPEK